MKELGFFGSKTLFKKLGVQTFAAIFAKTESSPCYDSNRSKDESPMICSKEHYLRAQADKSWNLSEAIK